MDFLWVFISGVMTGLVAGHLMRGGRFGWLGNSTVGIVGAAQGALLYAGWGAYSGAEFVSSPAAAALGVVLLFFLLGWVGAERTRR